MRGTQVDVRRGSRNISIVCVRERRFDGRAIIAGDAAGA